MLPRRQQSRGHGDTVVPMSVPHGQLYLDQVLVTYLREQFPISYFVLPLSLKVQGAIAPAALTCILICFLLVFVPRNSSHQGFHFPNQM